MTDSDSEHWRTQGVAPFGDDTSFSPTLIKQGGLHHIAQTTFQPNDKKTNVASKTASKKRQAQELKSFAEEPSKLKLALSFFMEKSGINLHKCGRNHKRKLSKLNEMNICESGKKNEKTKEEKKSTLQQHCRPEKNIRNMQSRQS